MTDEQPRAACPWCSAILSPADERCPSCGVPVGSAAAGEPSIPGLTTLDPAYVALQARATSARPSKRGLLASLFQSETPPPPSADLPPTAVAAALEPPSDDVRREMRRIALQAIEAEERLRAAAAVADGAAEAPAATGELDASAESASPAEAVAPDSEPPGPAAPTSAAPASAPPDPADNAGTGEAR